MDFTKVLNVLAGLGAWGCLFGLIFLSVVPASARPTVLPWHNLEHMLAFGVLGAIFAVAYPRHTIALVIALALFISVIEVVQAFLPTRHARWLDLVVNLISAYAGAILGRTFRKLSMSEEAKK